MTYGELCVIDVANSWRIACSQNYQITARTASAEDG